VSDKHIAVGCHGTILIFAVQGDSPGCWLSSAKVEGAQIEKLVFSSNRDELLAMLKAKNSSHKAIVYLASDFANDSSHSDETAKPLFGVEVAEWKDSLCEIAHAAFSRDGRKIVICTSHDIKGTSQIRILKKYSEKGWRKYGHSISLPVLERQDASPGMTGEASPFPFTARVSWKFTSWRPRIESLDILPHCGWFTWCHRLVFGI